MDTKSDISRCAHPECRAKFARFGDGELFVFPIADPEEWGLPKHAKQKVLWLCERCCSRFYIRLDRRHHQAQIVSRGGTHQAA